jgi:hypothetical protein
MISGVIEPEHELKASSQRLQALNRQLDTLDIDWLASDPMGDYDARWALLEAERDRQLVKTRKILKSTLKERAINYDNTASNNY